MRDHSILLEMYNSFLKDNGMRFDDIKTKYTDDINKLYNLVYENLHFDATDKLDELIELVRNDMREKFEYEKKLILKLGMQIGLDAPPSLTKAEIELLERVDKIKK